MINKYILRFVSISNQRLIMIAAIMTGLFYFFNDIGQRGSALDAQMASVNADVEKEKIRLKETERLLKKAQTQKEVVESLSERFKQSSKQLPSKVSSIEVMRVIESLAKTAGVFISSKEPSAPIKTGVLTAYPVRAEVRGAYSSIVMFMYYITTLEKISRIDKFSIVQQESGDVKIGQSKTTPLRLSISVLSYEYSGAEEKSGATHQGGVKK